MILYFIRHGQTDFNIKHILQGVAFDEPLNENGLKEMEDLLPSLPNDFEIIYSSPLLRVKTSADIISSYSHKTITITSDISERDFGSLAGKTWNDIPDGQELRKVDRAQKYDYRPFGGESVEDVKQRIERFFTEVRQQNHSKALVVSSSGIIRLIYKMLLDEEFPEVKNASIHKFEI